MKTIIFIFIALCIIDIFASILLFEMYESHSTYKYNYDSDNIFHIFGFIIIHLLLLPCFIPFLNALFVISVLHILRKEKFYNYKN